MHRNKSPLPVVICLVIVAAIRRDWLDFLSNRYSPTGKKMDKSEYYGLSSGDQAALIVNDEVLEEKGLVIDGEVYVDYMTVWNYLNSGYYWEAGASQLLLTLPAGTNTVGAGRRERCGDSG